MDILAFIQNSLAEDVGTGDHSSLACIDENTIGKAKLLVKENCVLAGVEIALQIFKYLDSDSKIDVYKKDGEKVEIGDVALEITAKSQAILKGERLALNIMQRMSAIATKTRALQDLITLYNCTILDTRKTTPGFRYFEKKAVEIGGGKNHRMGLYDMIMLKDNHIDYAGGISKAMEKVHQYFVEKKVDVPVEIEARDMEEVKEILAQKGVTRILLDNFSNEMLKEAVALIHNKIETEASGGITEETIVEVAKTGVQYISVGALTHAVKSVDLSLKAEI
jgi:nicotinate-nucleotide pyrophosphorylase (carboxylating)